MTFLEIGRRQLNFAVIFQVNNCKYQNIFSTLCFTNYTHCKQAEKMYNDKPETVSIASFKSGLFQMALPLKQRTKKLF